MHLERLTPTSGRRRGLRLASVLAVGGGLALSACGSSTKQAPAAVDSAISSLGSASSMSMTVSLGITADQAQQLSAHRGGSGMTPAEAQAVQNGSIFFTAQTGHGEALNSNQALTDPKDAFDVGLRIGSSTPVEVRYLSQALYVRAQVGQLLSDLGQSPAKAATIQSQLNQFNKYVPGISALGQGSWVEVSPSSLAALGSMVQQATGTSPAQIRAELAQLRTSALNALKANSTCRSVGTSGGRTEYAVTVNVHGFLASFGPTLQKDLQSLPMIGSKLSADFAQAQKKVPAGQTAVGDVYTSGGKLSEIDVDLNQFAGQHRARFAVPLKAVFTSPPPITTPTNAQVLDLSQLPNLLQGLLSGGLGATHGGGTTS